MIWSYQQRDTGDKGSKVQQPGQLGIMYHCMHVRHVHAGVSKFANVANE